MSTVKWYKNIKLPKCIKCVEKRKTFDIMRKENTLVTEGMNE